MPRVSKRVDSKRPQQAGVDEPLFGFLPLTPVLVSCADRHGRPNITPLIAWSFACRWPPQMTIGLCEVDWTPNYFVRASYRMIAETGEFVINFPDAALHEAVMLSGSLSARDPTVDKFRATGLTPGQPLVVNAPLIEECPISVECVVTEHLSLGSHHLFVGEVVAYHQLEALVEQESRTGVDTLRYRSPGGRPGRRLVWSGYPRLEDEPAAEEGSAVPVPIPIVSFIGRSGSGKTTVLERLVPELKRRGYRVAVIKHHHHAGLAFDVPGKDSERLARAGADQVIVAGPDRLMSMRRLARPQSLAEAVATIHDVDLIITEGYKGEHAPKIQVSRNGIGGGELLCAPEELLAVVADHPIAGPVPCFGLDDVAALADLLEARLLPRRGAGGG